MKNMLYVFIRAGKDLYLQVESYMSGNPITKYLAPSAPEGALQIISMRQLQNGRDRVIAREREAREELEELKANKPEGFDSLGGSYEMEEALSLHRDYLDTLKGEILVLGCFEAEIMTLEHLCDQLRETRFAPGVDATAPFLVLGWDIKSPKDSDIVKI